MGVLLYCIGLVFVGGALIGTLSSDPAWLALEHVKAELVKIALQVFVFGLVGGGVKLFLDKQAEYRAFRADMLGRLGNAHRDVYRIRRTLAADPRRNTELLGELMDVRQELGATYHFARTWGFTRKLHQVRAQTDAMRAYLERVIEGALAADGASERGAYDEFLDWRKVGGAYQAEFKKPYLIAKQLVDPSYTPTGS